MITSGIWSSWSELLAHRALVATLVGRQLSARYRGSILGFMWTFLNPILLMLVYTLVFSVYLRLDMEGYAVFMFTGLLPWLWFSSSLLEGMNSIVAGGHLVTRVLFPPQILPAVTVLAHLANFLVALPLLAVFLVIFDVGFSITLVALPLIMGIQLILTLGLALLLSSLNVHYRDVQHLMTNLLTLWFFLTPVLYPTDMIPAKFSRWLPLNPMAPLVTAYHDIIFYHRWPQPSPLAMSAAAAVLAILLGSWVLNRLRDSFAEDL